MAICGYAMQIGSSFDLTPVISLQVWMANFTWSDRTVKFLLRRSPFSVHRYSWNRSRTIDGLRADPSMRHPMFQPA